MSGIFSRDERPPAPQEDPAVALERQRQEQRAEQDRTRSIQQNLARESLLLHPRPGPLGPVASLNGR